MTRSLLLALAALSACAPPSWGTRPAPDAVGPPACPVGAGPPLAAQRGVNGDRFATSPTCAWCHSNAPAATGLRDPAGRPVSADALWRSSLHAAAARDPIARAAIARESALAAPAERGRVEHDCLRCHAPMLARTREERGEWARLAELYATTPEAQLGLDGVSCTACHQVEPAGLGGPDTFGGRFAIGRLRRAYGPHADPRGPAMIARVRFHPHHGPHLSRAAMCGSCHSSAGEAPLSRTYQEWRNSDFDAEREAPSPAAASCIDCHQPRTDAAGQPLLTRIARDPAGGDDRSLPARTLSRHRSPGGNVLALALLRDQARELRPHADTDELDEAIAEARQLLAHAATLELLRCERTARALAFELAVRSRVGHKLPTGKPFRRVWLRVRVVDAEGRALFASGEVDERGRLRAGDGLHPSEQPDAAPEPHRDRITRPEQVAIYEAVPAALRLDAGHPGLALAKDNRLLPRGWSAAHPDAEATRPIGVDGDPDFGPGADHVHYALALPEGAGPLRLELALLYQPLSPRWQAALGSGEAPESAALARYLAAADLAPLPLAQLRREIP